VVGWVVLPGELAIRFYKRRLRRTSTVTTTRPLTFRECRMGLNTGSGKTEYLLEELIKRWSVA
jgi:hypothetical protein